jgi:hypothetical protein
LREDRKKIDPSKLSAWRRGKIGSTSGKSKATPTTATSVGTTSHGPCDSSGNRCSAVGGRGKFSSPTTTNSELVTSCAAAVGGITTGSPTASCTANNPTSASGTAATTSTGNICIFTGNHWCRCRTNQLRIHEWCQDPKGCNKEMVCQHDLDQNHLHNFLEALRSQAIACGWDGNLATVIQGGVPLNIIDNYGTITRKATHQHKMN